MHYRRALVDQKWQPSITCHFRSGPMMQSSRTGPCRIHLLIMRFHYPGYNYLGPGTTDMTKEPTNSLDAAARRHDLAYDKYTDPYLRWNKADEDFYNEIKDETSVEASLARGIFYFKRTVNRLLGANYSTPKELPKKSKLKAKRALNRLLNKMPPKRSKKRKGSNKRKRSKTKKSKKNAYRRPNRKTDLMRRSKNMSNQPVTIRRDINSGAIQTAQGVQTWYEYRFNTLSGDSGFGTAIQKYTLNTTSGNFDVDTVDITGLEGANLFVTGGKVTHHIRSATPGGCYMTIYRVQSIRKGGADALTDFDTGIDDMQTADLGTTSLQSKLNDSLVFKQNWKICDTKVYDMPAGRQITYTANVIPHLHDYDDEDAHSDANRWYTQSILIKIVGKIGFEADHTMDGATTRAAADIDYDDVTTIPAQVCWIRRFEMRYKPQFFNIKRSSSITANALDTLTSAGHLDPLGEVKEGYADN